MTDEPRMPDSAGKASNRRNLIIAVTALVLVCACCALLVTAWFAGDSVMQFFQ